jgi:DNA-binding transcriptional ArsR family regulator
MSGEPEIAVPARAMGDPARARMLSALLGERALSAGELARIARLSPSSTSEHLHVLAEAGLVLVDNQGRHRYYRLANSDVARAIESLQAIAPLAQVNSLRAHRASREMREARTCYDHLAGDLGLRVTDLLHREGIIDQLEVGSVGQPPKPFPDNQIVRALGLRESEGSRRPWTRGCLDWTGRRPHAAGQVGAQVLSAFRANGWITPRPDSRAVQLTTIGERRLQELES